MRAAVLALLVAMLLGAAWGFYQFRSAPVSHPNTGIEVEGATLVTPETLNKKAAENFGGFQVTSLSGSVLPNEGTAEEKLALLENYYRLKPDMRFLNAIKDIDQFFTGQKSPGDIRLRFENNQWEVYDNDVLVGTLPELPDFPDYMALLTHWVGENAKEHPVKLVDTGNVTPDAKGFFYSTLMPELEACGAEWQAGTHSRACLRFAADAYSAILLQKFDNMGAFDILFSKPIAFLAITKTLTAEPMIREEAIIARETEYTTHARKLFSQLPKDDPAALFYLHQPEALQHLANQPDASLETLYFALMDLGKRDQREAFDAFIAAHKLNRQEYALPLINAELEQRAFSVGATRGQGLQHMTLYLLRGAFPEVTKQAVQGFLMALRNSEDIRVKLVSSALLKGMQVSEQDVVTSFETAISEQEKKYTTPFLSGDYVRAFYSGYFYSGIRIEAGHELNARSSIPDAEAILARFEFSQGAYQKEFARWYRNLIDAKKRTLSPESVFSNLQELRLIGLNGLLETYDENEYLFKFGAPEIRNTIKLLLSKLDSRPFFRAKAAYIIESRLYDLALSEKYYASAIEVDIDRISSRENMARRHQDTQTMLALAEDSSVPALQKSMIYEQMEHFNLPREQVKDIYETGMKTYPVIWKIVGNYAEFLRDDPNADRADKERALEVAQQWLTRNPDGDYFDLLFAATSIARSYIALGKYEEAAKVLEPLQDTWQGGVMDRYAWALSLLGKYEEAEIVFQKVLGRYPGTGYMIQDYAEMLWRTGRYSDAAQLVKASLNIPRESDQLAKRYGEIFKNDPEKARQAFQAFVDSGMDTFRLVQFTDYVSANGAPDVAFEQFQMIPNSGASAIFIPIESYKALKASKGKDVALAWVKRYQQSPERNRMSMPIFEEHQYDLLWGLIEEPLPNDYPEMVWLLRATAYRLVGGTPEQKAELEAFYQQPVGSNRIIAMGKYMMGLIPREELLEFAKNDNHVLCEAAFYIGARAMAEKDFAEANRWFQLALETAEIRNRESAWADRQLFDWYSDYISLKHRDFFMSPEKMKKRGVTVAAALQ